MLVMLMVTIVLHSSPALAWNGEGHQLIAWIAEERLSENAKVGTKELLADASLSDAQVASWADHIRRERRSSAPWHYVNIPVDAQGYDPAKHGNGGENVIDAIERFAKVLADKKAQKEERVEALKFLVHFVGDLHQPLHCADRNGDKGGNARLVFFPGRKKAVSLHMVWDSLILPRSKGKQSVADYGDALNDRITEEQAKAWAQGRPKDWAAECWQIAREVVYRGVPPAGDPPAIAEEYIVRAQPVVDEQIQKAGVRVAAALNLAFR
ncbi:MAG TPA: S1/P1 nuclease [Tepidisphaeraceae bacterium]|nr:S1/P1 nuclease [Tepidisphaeraceae bacterium]